MWGLDIVTLPDHGDVTLDVTFTPGGDVIRVGQDGPLVIKLVLWERRQSIRPTLGTGMVVKCEPQLLTRLGVNGSNIHLEVSDQSPTPKKIFRMNHLKNGAGSEIIQ